MNLLIMKIIKGFFENKYLNYRAISKKTSYFNKLSLRMYKENFFI